MKELTLVPIGGLANRVYAVTSAVGFCRDNHLRLRIIWFKDVGMGACFRDLFSLRTPAANVKVIDANIWDFFLYAKPRKGNLWLPNIYQRRKFDSIFSQKELFSPISLEQWYQLQKDSNTFYVTHCSKFYGKENPCDLLVPVNPVQEMINERLKLLSTYTVGIHMRRTDLLESIMKSPLSAFVEKMKQEIRMDPKVNFYVASDSKEEKRKLQSIFGERIITMDKRVKRNTKEGIRDALIELFALANTRKLYGSFQSTYSMLAAEIGQIPVEIPVGGNEYISA